MQLAKIPKMVLRQRGIEALGILFCDTERVKTNTQPTYRFQRKGEPVTIVIKTGFRFISALRSPDDACWSSLRDIDHVLFCTEGDADGKTVRRYLFPNKAVCEAFDKERARRVAECRWKRENRTYIDLSKTADDIVKGLIGAATWADAVAA